MPEIPLSESDAAIREAVAAVRRERGGEERVLHEIDEQIAALNDRRAAQMKKIERLGARERMLATALDEDAATSDAASSRDAPSSAATGAAKSSRRWTRPKRLDDLGGRLAVAVAVFRDAGGTGLSRRDFVDRFRERLPPADRRVFDRYKPEQAATNAWDSVITLRANRDHLGVDFVQGADERWRMVSTNPTG
jgi:hypothetical protein